MPTRIAAGVGDHPCFHTFITTIPIDYKITNFSLHLFVCFVERSPLLLLGMCINNLIENL